MTQNLTTLRNKKRPLLITIAIFLFFITAFTIGNNEKYQNDKWVAPDSAKKLKNPSPDDKNSIKRGKSIYNTRCVVCHGETGQGDGPGSKALNPKPANHTSSAVHSQTDGEIFWKITKGRGSMIGWEKIIIEQDRWDLVNYIRTLKK